MTAVEDWSDCEEDQEILVEEESSTPGSEIVVAPTKEVEQVRTGLVSRADWVRTRQQTGSVLKWAAVALFVWPGRGLVRVVRTLVRYLSDAETRELRKYYAETKESAAHSRAVADHGTHMRARILVGAIGAAVVFGPVLAWTAPYLLAGLICTGLVVAAIMVTPGNAWWEYLLWPGAGLVAWLFLRDWVGRLPMPPTWAFLSLAALAWIALAVVGHQRTSVRTSLLEDELGGSVEDYRLALIDAGIVKEGQELRAPELPHQDGAGVAAVFDLPRGVTVSKVVARREELASALAVDAAYMVLEKGRHNGQLRFWAAVDNPFAGAPVPHPLLDLPRWNAWNPAPFGLTARKTQFDLRLAYSNLLCGGKPGSGKTFSMRAAALPYVLDPRVRVFCANGKGDAAWDAIEPLCETYIKGRRDEHMVAVDEMLDEVIGEMDDRYDRFDGISKITEEMADEFEFIVVIVDELQEYTACSMPGEPVRGSKASLGQNIDFKLTTIAKLGRAAGIILLLGTQRPSATTLSTELRAQLGTRFANKVMDGDSSDMVLGDGMRGRGYNAAQLDAKTKGLGILIPDMDEPTADVDEFPTVRTFLVDDGPWKVACKRGLVLRQEEGRGSGPRRTVVQAEVTRVDSAGDAPEPAPDLLADCRAIMDREGARAMHLTELAELLQGHHRAYARLDGTTLGTSLREAGVGISKQVKRHGRNTTGVRREALEPRVERPELESGAAVIPLHR